MNTQATTEPNVPFNNPTAYAATAATTEPTAEKTEADVIARMDAEWNVNKFTFSAQPTDTGHAVVDAINTGVNTFSETEIPEREPEEEEAMVMAM